MLSFFINSFYYYVNCSLCFYILRKNKVKARVAIAFTEIGLFLFKHIIHPIANSENKFLYLIDIISVNLVRQYNDCPLSNS
jgi:hypothetical protein